MVQVWFLTTRSPLSDKEHATISANHCSKLQFLIRMAIQHINLAAIDLNLLVVFDALMAEKHVTRAAEKLGLSQPATSNALSRLRSLLNDALFVRTPTGMQPTPKALALAEPIQQVLLQIQTTLNEPIPFEPDQSDRIFTIGTTDYVEFILLPQLMATLQAIAPHARVQVKAAERQQLLRLVDDGAIDLAIGVFSDCSSWQIKQPLFREQFVGVMRQREHATSHPITLEDYLRASHLLVSPHNEDLVGWVDQVLEQKNLKRHVAIAVPHFLVAPFVLAQTDLIATLAERVAQTYAQVLNLRVFSLPFEAGGFEVSAVWHSKNNTDPAHMWLRQLVNDSITIECPNVSPWV